MLKACVEAATEMMVVARQSLSAQRPKPVSDTKH